MILVTGATGNIGGELVKQLASMRVPVRALVRNKNRGGMPVNVEQAVGDLDRPESLASALEGVRGVFLLGGYSDMPGVLSQIHRAGVEHVVLLSSRSVIDGNGSNAIVKMWMNSEDAVRTSGVAWTILRPSGFDSNALRWLPQMRSGEVIRVSFADVPIASIDPYDIAAVAAVTLTSKGHESKSYALTGPESSLPEDQVRTLAAVLGRNLRIEKLSDAAAIEELRKSMPPDLVDAFTRFFIKGEFNDSTVLPTVQQLTSRTPRTFEQWARAHADAFR